MCGTYSTTASPVKAQERPLEPWCRPACPTTRKGHVEAGMWESQFDKIPGGLPGLGLQLEVMLPQRLEAVLHCLLRDLLQGAWLPLGAVVLVN